MLRKNPAQNRFSGPDEDEVARSPENNRKFIIALARGLDVLRAFQPDKGPLSNAELSAITGIPKPTISRLAYTLTELGYLAFSKQFGKYELSPAVLALGYPVLSNLKVRHVAHAQMQQLADHSGGFVALATRSRLSMIYVDACSASTLSTLRLDIGSRIGMVHSAIGRAFLAGIGETEREYFYSHFSRRFGSEWPQIKALVEDSIEQVRSRGFCLADGEWERDICGVGTPLVSTDGRTVMAMNCSGPSFLISKDRLENDIGPRLVHLCRSIAPLV